jgi:hypothetical protein
MIINDLYNNKKQNISEGMAGKVVFSGTGDDGGTYEIIQSSPTDFMIHANGRHIDTYSSLQRAMSVLQNEVLGLQQGVAEGMGPVTHRIGLTVTDPNHPMVSKRKEPYQKSIRITQNVPDREAAINQAIVHYRRKGYKVHDHHYIGTVDQGMAEGLSEMDKSQTPPGRDGSNDEGGKKEYPAKIITPKKAVKDGVKILNKVLNKKQGMAEGGIATVDWPDDEDSHTNNRPPVNVGGTFDARPVVKRGSLVKASGLTGVYRVMDILRDEAKIVQEIPRTGVSTYVPMSDLRVWTNKPIVREQGMAEGQLELNTPDPVVVVQDQQGKILDKINLSVAAQKYKLGQPDNIKKQLAHQNYTKIGSYTIVSPMTGQPQDATTQGVAEGIADDMAAMAQEKFPNAYISKNGQEVQKPENWGKKYVPPTAAPADLEKQQRDLTAKYPNIDELVRRAELNRDPDYEMADGQAYYAARDAEQNYLKLKQIQRVIQGLNESLNRSHLP